MTKTVSWTSRTSFAATQASRSFLRTFTVKRWRARRMWREGPRASSARTRLAALPYGTTTGEVAAIGSLPQALRQREQPLREGSAALAAASQMRKTRVSPEVIDHVVRQRVQAPHAHGRRGAPRPEHPDARAGKALRDRRAP